MALTETEELELLELEEQESSVQPVQAQQPAQAQPQIQQEGVAGTVADQALQGATFGFADEIQDVIGALIAGGLSEDLTVGQAFIQAQELSEGKQARQIEQNPIASVVGNLIGAISTGKAFTVSKTGKTLVAALKSGGKFTKAAKLIGVSGITGAAFGAGTAKEGERVEGAKTGLAVGAAASVVAPIAGAAVAKTARGVKSLARKGAEALPDATGFVKRTAQRLLGRNEIIPNSDELRKQAGKLFKEADAKGGMIISDVTDEFVEKANKITPQTAAGKIVAGKEDVITKMVERINLLKGKPLTLQAVQEVDELIGDAIEGQIDVTGRLDKIGNKFLNLQTALRETIDNAKPSQVLGGKEGFDSINRARKLWAKSAKLADIERIIFRAERFEKSPANAIKSGFKNLALNRKKIRGFSADERAAIEKAAETGVVDDLLGRLGSKLPSIISLSTGGGLGASSGLAAGSIGSSSLAARKGIEQAKSLADLIVTGRISKKGANPLLSVIGTQSLIQGR